MPLLHSTSPGHWLIPCSGTEPPLAYTSLEPVAVTIRSPRECFFAQQQESHIQASQAEDGGIIASYICAFLDSVVYCMHISLP